MCHSSPETREYQPGFRCGCGCICPAILPAEAEIAAREVHRKNLQDQLEEMGEKSTALKTVNTS